ncbi:MAG: hypothetical protein NVS4B9_07700 [Ktedonobacteraceae bacterium]
MPLIVLFLYSFVPTVVLGVAFAIVQHYDDRARSLEENAIRSKDAIESLQKRYIEEIEGLSKRNGEESHKISGLIDGFNTLVKDTGTTLKFYSTVRTILEDGYAQKDLIRAFLNRAMNGPLFIQPMDREEFYNLAEQGIRQCTFSWQAIHQGQISELEHFTYLSVLKKDNTTHLKKQRIVILKKEEISELNDYNKVDQFLKATEGMLSYWINEDDFFTPFGVPKTEIDDAALYDGKLLIMRRRDIKLVMMSLQPHKDRIHEGIIKAFVALNFDLDRNLAGGRFHKIELPSRSLHR